MEFTLSTQFVLECKLRREEGTLARAALASPLLASLGRCR